MGRAVMIGDFITSRFAKLFQQTGIWVDCQNSMAFIQKAARDGVSDRLAKTDDQSDWFVHIGAPAG
jgi:hypothetical protein